MTLPSFQNWYFLNRYLPYPSLASVAPTILSFLGIPVKSEWKLDGPSLLGKIGVRKLFRDGQGTLTWVSDSPNKVSIYKKDQLVAEVPAKAHKWTDPNPSPKPELQADAVGEYPITDYVLSLNKNPVAYRFGVQSPWNRRRNSLDKLK